MIFSFFVSLVLLFGTALNGTLPWQVAAATASGAGDITSPGILLGDNWYRFETFQGKSFRWVNNNAAFTITSSTAKLVFLTIGVEGGPGLNTTSFPLRVLDATGRQVDAVQVTAQQPEQTLILPVIRGANVFLLHVDGGGRHDGADPRTLNFRVFSLGFPGVKPVTTVGVDAQQPGTDIAGTGVSVGTGWYPLEHFKGATFRWVNNNAHFSVTASKDGHAQLALAVESGPGMNSKQFTLQLQEKGASIGFADVLKQQTTIYYDVDLKSGTNDFILHAAGGGMPAPHDPRTLNFRVFHIGVTT